MYVLVSIFLASIVTSSAFIELILPTPCPLVSKVIFAISPLPSMPSAFMIAILIRPFISVFLAEIVPFIIVPSVMEGFFKYSVS